MNDYGRLAYTGLGAFSLFGVLIDQMWLAVLALLLVVAGATAIRLGWRRNQPVNGR